jgi:hypothetical protein
MREDVVDEEHHCCIRVGGGSGERYFFLNLCGVAKKIRKWLLPSAKKSLKEPFLSNTARGPCGLLKRRWFSPPSLRSPRIFRRVPSRPSVLFWGLFASLSCIAVWDGVNSFQIHPCCVCVCVCGPRKPHFLPEFVDVSSVRKGGKKDQPIDRDILFCADAEYISNDKNVILVAKRCCFSLADEWPRWRRVANEWHSTRVVFLSLGEQCNSRQRGRSGWGSMRCLFPMFCCVEPQDGRFSYFSSMLL